MLVQQKKKQLLRFSAKVPPEIPEDAMRFMQLCLMKAPFISDVCLSLGLQIPSQKVFWGVFRSLSTFLEGILGCF